MLPSLIFPDLLNRFCLKKSFANNKMLSVKIELTFPVQREPCVTTEDFNRIIQLFSFSSLMVSIFTTICKLVVCYGLDLLPQIQSEKIHNKTMASWIFEEVFWLQKEGNTIIYLPFCSLHLFNHTSLCRGVEDNPGGVSYRVQHSANTGSC